MASASVGLSYSDFLQMSPVELQVYSSGSQLYLNRLAWMIGIYVQDAVAACLSAAFAKKGANTFKYPERPHDSLQPTDQKEQEQTSEQKEKTELLKARLYMHRMMWAGKNWGAHT